MSSVYRLFNNVNNKVKPLIVIKFGLEKTKYYVFFFIIVEKLTRIHFYRL